MLYWTIGMTYAGMAMVEHGDYRAALRHIDEFRALVAEMNNIEFTAQAYTTAQLVYLLGADYAKAIETGLYALELGEKTHDLILMITLHRALAWAYARSGDPTSAEASSARARAIMEQLGGDVPLGAWFAAAEMERMLAQPYNDSAIVRAEELLERTRAADSIFPSGLLYRALAQATPTFTQAENYLNQSIGMFEAGEARAEVARTRVVYGDLLRANGSAADARRQWQAAADIFESGGFEREFAEVQARLAPA
jgi:hypothetical protein